MGNKISKPLHIWWNDLKEELKEKPKEKSASQT